MKDSLILDLRVKSGSVECDLPLEGTIKKNSINAKINGGGPKVALHTSGGGINVVKR